MEHGMNFDSKTPVYLQLCSYIRSKIFSGELNSGTRLPSIRKIANDAQVNANTVQHTMICLKWEGLLEIHRGKGYSVTTDAEKIKRQRQELAQDTIQRFL
jgi:GntR family transcriptional regulator